MDGQFERSAGVIMPWSAGVDKRARTVPRQMAGNMSGRDPNAAKERIQHIRGLPQYVGSGGLHQPGGWYLLRADGALELVLKQKQGREHVRELTVGGRAQQPRLGRPEGQPG